MRSIARWNAPPAARTPLGEAERLDCCRAGQSVTIRALAWGGSSVGRAPRSQCGGRGFDPLPLHQTFSARARSSPP